MFFHPLPNVSIIAVVVCSLGTDPAFAGEGGKVSNVLPPPTQIQSRAQVHTAGVAAQTGEVLSPIPTASQSNHASYPSAVLLQAVLGQSVLSEADFNELYNNRDQLTIDQVIDILLKLDQNISQEAAQRWYSLLYEKHQQALKKTDSVVGLDGSGGVLEMTDDDFDDLLRSLFPEVPL